MNFSSRRRIIGSLAWGFTAFTLFLSSFSATFAAETRNDLVSGVTFVKDTTSSGRDLRALVADTSVVTVRPEGKTSCGAKFSSDQFNALGNTNNVVGLINANFFDGSAVLGDYIGNQVYLGKTGSSSYFAIKTDGQYELNTGQLTPERASQYKMYIGGIYRIDSIQKPLAQMTASDINARFSQIYSHDVSDAQGSIARTFLGVNEAGHKLILFTGGQGANRNQGVTPQEGIDFLKRQGATAAYNLDSGSSTMMRINSRLSPSDQGGGTLNNGGLATLLVVRTDTSAPAATPLNCRGTDTAAATNNTPTDTTNTGSNPGSAPAQQVIVPAGAIPLEAPINGTTTISSDGGVIANYARILFSYAAGIAGTIALLMLIVSGIQIIIGGGGEQANKAKERIVGVLSGLFLLGTGGYILYLVNPCFFTFGTSTACQVRSTRYENPNFQTTGVNQFISGPAGGQTASNTTRTRARSPQVYAQEKLSMIKGWWQSYNADIVRISHALAPNAAPEFFMGVASNGGLRENTTGFLTGLPDERAAGVQPPLGGVASQSFHELGWFGVEGGPRGGPAPGAGSNWSNIATSQEVRTLLSREGVTAPGSWAGAVPDQLAIGIINNRTHGRNVNNALPTNIQAHSEDSLWFLAMTTMGWSAGDARAARIIRMVANDIASVPENQRWGALVRAFAAKGADGSILSVQENGVYDVYNNPFFAVIRTMQKIEAGLALARDHGGNVAFFEDGLGSNRQQIHTTLTNLAFYGTPTGQ